MGMGMAHDRDELWGAVRAGTAAACCARKDSISNSFSPHSLFLPD